jgi:hypothetical protein
VADVKLDAIMEELERREDEGEPLLTPEEQEELREAFLQMEEEDQDAAAPTDPEPRREQDQDQDQTRRD